MSSEEFKERFGQKIEISLAALDRAELVESHYYSRSARFEVEFSWHTEAEQAKLDVKTALAQIAATLPDNWPNFGVYYRTNNSTDIYITVSSEIYSQEAMYHLLNERLLSQLETIEGIDNPRLYKNFEEFIQIELKQDVIEARGIHPKIIKDALENKEFDKNLGVYQIKRSSYILLISKKDKSLSDIKETLIPIDKNHNIKLSEIAKISLARKRHDSIYKTNGKAALLVHASVKPGGNISKVSKEVVAVMEKIPQTIDCNLKINVVTNPAEFIDEAIKNIIYAILMGFSLLLSLFFSFLAHSI